ncbi:MAG: hypothetical protein FJY98_04410 [Candidatus Liptonbacteria bacterium]|nr:hypothetical protein [Candidatus Liptonbacteria bacterium]
MTMMKKKTALISVFHKEGITEFASALKTLGWEIIASGGTAKHLKGAGVEVVDATDIVGVPILGHRVVTLSRGIHAGLLAKRTPEHAKELEENNIPYIDLVCVDMYPLEEEIAKGSVREAVVEMTDIGGPTMLRSGVKGGRIVICDPADRMRVIEWLREKQANNEDENKDEQFIRELAAKAEATVAKYVLTSAAYLGEGKYAGIAGTRTAECLYGENGWQTPAALYSTGSADPLSLEKFTLIEGSPLSFNNFGDLDRLLQTLTHIAAGLEVNFGANPVKSAAADHGVKIAVAVKHGNPCGAAYGESSKQVLENVIAGDPLAIMGGVVMTNFPIGASEAETLASFKMPQGFRRLLDAVAAPKFESEAVELLRRKKDKCRFVANEALLTVGATTLDNEPRIRYVRGGFLRQPNYTFVPNLNPVKSAGADHGVKRYGPAATPKVERDLIFAWAVGSTSNSNTITIVKAGQLLGDGVGQQDRVGAAELALRRAKRSGHDTMGAVAYSDSFFPFPDAPQVLIDGGIRAIFSTSGSVRDEETIKLCEAKGIILYLVPDKEGRGFFGH